MKSKLWMVVIVCVATFGSTAIAAKPLEAALQQLDAIITKTVAKSIAEIEAVATLDEMELLAAENDAKVEALITEVEIDYDVVIMTFDIEVYNEVVDESVWIDPIHICGSAGS